MKYALYGLAIIAVLVVTFAVVKKVSPVGWGMWGTTNTSSDVAIAGHDPMAYFEDSSAALGSDDYTFDWADATWQFQNAENRDRFASDPEQYAPQFGGFCSFAVSKGFTADIDPEAWHILDGRLYLFADQNVRDSWVSGLDEGSLQASEASWRKR